MNIPDLNVMNIPDVQSTSDNRHIAIPRVGVKGVRYPLNIKLGKTAQNTVASCNLYVHLPENRKGTHMSRFISLLERYHAHFDLTKFRLLLNDMLQLLEAEAGRIELFFPYFIKKSAPISGVESLMDYEVGLIGEICAGHLEMSLKLTIPVTSLCPCSKEVSEYGAHNQRSHITAEVLFEGEIALEELIANIEKQASCELYGLLKRSDEKYVTERAYNNPKFVEDLVRDVAALLNAEQKILAYKLEVENFESIHNHSAYASIDRDKRERVEVYL